MALRVLVAHSGKTFELDCQSNTRCVLFSTGGVGMGWLHRATSSHE